jgi:hypothetical protein
VGEPLRIFIGTDETQIVAHEVLAYTIRKHASVPVDVTPMLDVPVRLPKDPANNPRTGFSFYRYKIPELCGYRGRALYLDPDMLALGDVAELATLPFGAHSVLCTNQPAPPKRWEGDPKFRPGLHSAVMLLDCSRLRWKLDEIVDGLDEGRYTYAQLRDLSVFDSDEVGATIPTAWNHLEHYEPGVTRLVHFTVVHTQPWKTDGNPLDDLWTSWYREALEAGAVSTEAVARSVLAGDVKASLAEWLAHAPEGSPAMAAALLELDEARVRTARLDRELASLKASSSWRIGSRLVRTLRAPRRVFTGRRSQ